MREKMCRRQVLRHGLGMVGVLAGLGIPSQGAAEGKAPGAPSTPVAIQRCTSFEPQPVRASLDAALEAAGGLKKLVSGKHVTVKLNLTGEAEPCLGLPAGRAYQTHPSMVGALCAALSDAGARRIVLVESFYFREPPERALAGIGYDIAGVRSAGNQRVEFINTRNRGKHADYAHLNVPDGGLLFPAFYVNRAYVDTDVVISLAKLKEHPEAGLTCAAKNLFGITPQALYGSDAPNENSVTARVKILHIGMRPVPDGVPQAHHMKAPAGGRIGTYRVPRIVRDLNCARPVDLAIVEGIETIAGGAGYWDPYIEHVQPGVLIAGRNAVCTDAVCAAVMGLDPTAAHGAGPFEGENHLRLLAEAGAGTNDPGQIEVRGLSIADALYPFNRLARQAAVRKSGRSCARSPWSAA